jgi:hypothetical protein
MALQIACLVESIETLTRRLTYAVFLDVVNAFNIVWVEGLFYKLTILNFSSYLVKPYLHISITARSKGPSNQLHPRVVSCGLGWLRADTSLICCSVCMLTCSWPPATSRSPPLLVRYLETYLNTIELWLRDWSTILCLILFPCCTCKWIDVFDIVCSTEFPSPAYPLLATSRGAPTRPYVLSRVHIHSMVLMFVFHVILFKDRLYSSNAT